MLVKHLKKEGAYKPSAQVNLGFLNFGEDNLYPQNLIKILSGSPTASSCVDVYKHFLGGDGFKDDRVNSLVVNIYGDTFIDLLKKIVADYAVFGGFAIHIYNQDLIHIPFEFVRLGIPDEDWNVNYYAIYDDWAREKINEIHPFTGYGILREMIDYVPAFTPDPRISYQQRRGAGNYRGQLYYYYMDHQICQYPLPVYYSALTDMSTEAGIINLSYRNARMGFFPAGILTKVDAESKNEKEMAINAKEVMEAMREFQGDTNAGKIMYIPTDDPANVPQFIPFATQNLDSMFDITNQTVKDRIGRTFNQPPILRSEDVGSNFGQDAIANAYQFYNSICEKHRTNIQNALIHINNVINVVNSEMEILPPTYIDKEDIRKFNNDEITNVMYLLQSDLNPDQIKQMLVMAYGLDEKSAELLLDREAYQQKQDEHDLMVDNSPLYGGTPPDSTNTPTQNQSAKESGLNTKISDRQQKEEIKGTLKDNMDEALDKSVKKPKKPQ